MEEIQIRKIAVAAKQKWLDETFGSKKAVEAWVASKMNNAAGDIMMRLIGFEQDSFSRGPNGWRIDHCNGRAGNSVIGEYINSTCKMAVEKWAKENLKALPTIEPGALVRIHSDYQKELLRAVESKMREAAQRKAEEIVKSLVSEMGMEPAEESPF